MLLGEINIIMQGINEAKKLNKGRFIWAINKLLIIKLIDHLFAKFKSN